MAAEQARSQLRSGKRPVVEVENVNLAGRKGHNVDAAKYLELRRALLRVLPRRAPGLTQAEMFAAVREQVSAELFPGGAKVEWWAKTVQLDLEAKGLLLRSADRRPLHWRRAR